MPRNTKQSIPYAQQQLLEAIAQIKEDGTREQVLPKLEAVLAQLQLLVTHDHLTGALNHKTLIERLDAELQRTKRTGHTFTVAVIAMDRLQDISDQLGADNAKQILQMFTTEACLVLRGLDSFGRISSTDFAIVMPTTWSDQSLIAIKRLKLGLQERDWSQVAPGFTMSFCAGLSTNAPNDTAEQLLARATLALRQAQQQGYDAIAQLDAELPDFDSE